MKKIAYSLGDSGLDEFIFEISTELKKYVEHTSFFICGKPGYDYLIKKGVNKDNILLLDHENQTKITKPNLNFLKNAEERFDFNIWDCWETSAQRKKSRRKIPLKKVLIRHEYYIKELESFFDSKKIDDHVLYSPASFVDIIKLKLIKKKGTNLIGLQSSPFQKGLGYPKIWRENGKI